MKSRERQQIFNAFKGRLKHDKRGRRFMDGAKQEQEQAARKRLTNLQFGFDRAADTIDLLSKATFPGSEAPKIAASLDWLYHFAGNLKSEIDNITATLPKPASPATAGDPAITEAQEPKAEVPKLEVVSPEAPAQPAPEAVSAGQDQAAGEVTPAPSAESAQEIGEAADTLK
jgi:hypothetical protein